MGCRSCGGGMIYNRKALGAYVPQGKRFKGVFKKAELKTAPIVEGEADVVENQDTSTPSEPLAEEGQEVLSEEKTE